MSDNLLRDLERRWLSTGACGDLAKLLVERVRVGDLEKSRLQIAAYCGDVAAAIALGVEPSRSDDGELWLSGLRAFGRRVCVAAALAPATMLLESFETRAPQDSAPREALSQALRFVIGSAEAGNLNARKAAGEAYLSSDRVSGAARLAALAAAFSCKAVYDSDPLGWPGENFEAAIHALGVEETVESVRKELLTRFKIG